MNRLLLLLIAEQVYTETEKMGKSLLEELRIPLFLLLISIVLQFTGDTYFYLEIEKYVRETLKEPELFISIIMISLLHIFSHKYIEKCNIQITRPLNSTS